MDKALSYGVHLKLDDKLSAAAARALKGMLQQTQRMQSDMNRLAKSGVNAQISEFKKLGAAREVLGIRSEKAVQNEIKKTEAAYKRLLESGKLSWSEQGRAADAMKRKVTELRNEMGRMTAAQRAASIGTGLRNTAFGIGAAAMVVKPALDRAMAYDLRLARVSNTAFATRDLAGRQAGMRELDGSVIDAVRRGGGTRDDALDAINNMVASNMAIKDAITALPTIMKASMGTGATAQDLSAIAIAAQRNMGIGPDRLDRVLNIAGTGGKLGSFELRDMAIDLPSQMAMATKLGLNGEQGLAKLVAMNQVAAIGSGSARETGTNMANFLNKINSPETVAAFKERGINLTGRYARDAGQGIDSATSFLNVIEEVVQKDPRWKTLQGRYANAKDKTEQQQILQAQQDIIEGSVVGSIARDFQFKKAVLPLMNNRGLLEQITQTSMQGGLGYGPDHDLIATTPSYKASQLGNESVFAQTRALEGMSGVIGDVSSKLTEYAQKYPDLTTAIVAVTGAATAAAAALASVSLAGMFFGGKGKGGGVSKMSRVKGAAGWLGRAAPWLAMLGIQEKGAGDADPVADQEAMNEQARKTGMVSGMPPGMSFGKGTVPVGGQIDLVVTDERVIVRATSTNPNVPINVYNGPTMVPN